MPTCVVLSINSNQHGCNGLIVAVVAVDHGVDDTTWSAQGVVLSFLGKRHQSVTAIVVTNAGLLQAGLLVGILPARMATQTRWRSSMRASLPRQHCGCWLTGLRRRGAVLQSAPPAELVSSSLFCRTSWNLHAGAQLLISEACMARSRLMIDLPMARGRCRPRDLWIVSQRHAAACGAPTVSSRDPRGWPPLWPSLWPQRYSRGHHFSLGLVTPVAQSGAQCRRHLWNTGSW